jgi:hypothetical protein
VLARPSPPVRRAAVLEAAPIPETTVAIPPRATRAPSDAPAPAALPPTLAPVPTADPIVRTTVSAGFFTALGVFSCQTRTPYPAAAPISPANTHSSISALHLPERPPHRTDSARLRAHHTSPSALRHHPIRVMPSGRGRESVAARARQAGARDNREAAWGTEVTS